MVVEPMSIPIFKDKFTSSNVCRLAAPSSVSQNVYYIYYERFVLICKGFLERSLTKKLEIYRTVINVPICKTANKNQPAAKPGAALQRTGLCGGK